MKEEKAKLEGMIQSYDELIMEMADEYGLNCVGEDADDEDEDDDAAPPAAVPPPVPAPPAAAPKVIIIEVEEDLVQIVPKQEAPEVHVVILADAEQELPQPRLFNVLVRDYEESPLRMMNDLADLDDPTEVDYDVNEWFPKDESND
jgi:hypothetical protein